MLAFLDANSEKGAAEIEQTYCDTSVFTGENACDTDASHQIHVDNVSGGVALGLGALGALIVFLTPRGGGGRPKPSSSSEAQGPRRDTKHKLQELEDLRAAGSISDAEYSAARKRVLDEI